MTSAFLRFSALGAVISLVAGCGGSSGGGSGMNSTTITYSFGDSAPTAVAVQIGSGSFAPATVVNGKLSFSLPEGTTYYAVAYACPEFSLLPGYTQVLEYLNYSSSLDRSANQGGCFSSSLGSGPGGGSTPTGTLTGSVNSGSFPEASGLFVWALAQTSGFGQGFNLAQGDDFSMFAPQGTDNVVLMLYDSSGNALAVKSAGSQTVPGAVDNGSPVDFGSGDATTLQPITYVNVPAGYSVPSTTVTVEPTGLSRSIPLQMNGSFAIPPGSQNLLTQYAMLPASIAQSGDIYRIQSSASEQLSSATSSVTFTANLIGGGPATVTFPVPWPYAGPTPAALPTLDFSYAGSTGQSKLSYGGNFQWAPPSGVQDLIDISLTPNYQSVSPSVTVPDLSAIPGFLAAPAPGTTVSWFASIGQASSSGTYTVP